MTRVGVIGVGQLGSRLAWRLRDAGHDVSVYDVDKDTLLSTARSDLVVRRSVADLTTNSDVVVTCVTDPAAVRDVCLGPGGVVSAVRSGTLLVDTTTSLPSLTREVAAALAERDAIMVDAPVSRGIPAAEQGTLSAMVGGSVEAYRRALPVLRTFATDIANVGGAGAGHAVKLWNMQLMAVHQVALIEALWHTRRAGLSTGSAVAAFQAGRARTYLTSNHFPKYVLTGSYDSKFTAALMRKDLGLALELARELDVPAPLAQRTMDVYDRACSVGLDVADNMRLAPFWWAVLSDASPGRAASAARNAGREPDTGVVDTERLTSADEDLGARNQMALSEVRDAVAAYGLPVPSVFSMINASSGASRCVDELLTASPTPPTL